MPDDAGHERFRRPVAGGDVSERGADTVTPRLGDGGDSAPAGQRPRVEPVPLGYAPDVEADTGERQPGLLDRLLGRARRRERLNALNFAIASYPESPVNYVLRGELYLAARDDDQAAHDFEMALSLADSAFTQSDWGLVAQSARDRALVGLRRLGR